MLKDDAYVLEIVTAATKLARHLGDADEAGFLSDELLQDGVMLQLIVIGEAVKNLSEGFRLAHPEIPWARIRGTRNIITHVYGQVRLDKIWDAASLGVPDLLAKLGPLVVPDDGSEPPTKLTPRAES